MRSVALLCSLVLTTFLVASANAATVTTILTLDGATDSVNTFDLSLVGGAAETTISGTMIAELEMDLFTGVISSINFTGGDIVTSAWTMTGSALGPVNATAGTATADTIPATSLVTAGEFAANEHRIRLLTGTVQPGDVGLGGTDIEGTGTGTITSVLENGEFSIVFSMNVDDDEEFPLPPPATDPAMLGITGTVVARGTVTAIPEPSAAFAMMACSAFVVVRRRRR